MIDFQDGLDFVGLSLLVAFLSLAIPGVRRLPMLGRAAVGVLALLLVWAPLFQREPLLFYVRGLCAGISVPTIVLLGLALARGFGWRTSYTRPLPRDLAGVVVILFGFLYLSTLGYWHLDLYALGYQPRGLLLVAGVLLAWAWWRTPGLALAWLGGIAAFACGVGPSGNLWDALGDPLLVVASCWRLVFSGYASDDTSYGAATLAEPARRRVA